MVIILPQGGQLQSYLKLDFGEIENHLWAHVESKISKKKKKKKKKERKKLAGLHTYTDGQELDSPFHRQSSLSRFHPPFYISSYAVLLPFFFLVNIEG